MRKKIIISAGGTGGHIFPAIGTAEKLQAKDPNIEVMFAAGGLHDNPFFDRNRFAWQSISSSPFVKDRRLLAHSWAILKGIYQSLKLLSCYKPDLVVGFGSYHSFPILMASKLLGIRFALHEQNSKPGKVNRLFSKSACVTGVYFPTATQRLKGRSMLLPMPLREQFSKQNTTKEQACEYFGIDPEKMTLLLFGGSQGSRFINQQISKLLTRLHLDGCHFQILHFTGSDVDGEQLKANYKQLNIKAVIKATESRMDLAWQAADLAVVRAGAGTIAEQIEFEVPAIYIPYPHAADGHQDSNADFVVDKLKGGWKWKEENWHEYAQQAGDLLASLVKKRDLLVDRQQNLAAYKGRAYTKDFVDILLEIIKS